MTYMVISHHIASELAGERRRDLQESAGGGRRLLWPFGKRAAELEPVPPVRTASAAGGASAPQSPRAEAPVRARRIAPARRRPAASHGRAHNGSRDRTSV